MWWGTDEVQVLLKIVNVFMQVQNNPKALISKKQQKMTSHTKQAMYKMCGWKKLGVGGAEVDKSHLHIDMDLVAVQPSARVLTLWPLYCFKHTHPNREPRLQLGLSHTSPPAARGGWGCRAQTSAACVSPPGPGAEMLLFPPGTGHSCPRPQIPEEDTGLAIAALNTQGSIITLLW